MTETINPALLLGSLLKATIPADLLADDLDEQIAALANQLDKPLPLLKCPIETMPDDKTGYSMLHHDVKDGCNSCSALLSVVVYLRFERNPDGWGTVNFYGAYCPHCAEEILKDSDGARVYLMP